MKFSEVVLKYHNVFLVGMRKKSLHWFKFNFSYDISKNSWFSRKSYFLPGR